MILKQSGAEVTFKEDLTWDVFEQILGSVGFKIRNYAHLLIEKVKLGGDIEIEGPKINDWIGTLSAKDGIVLITKLNLIVSEVQEALEDDELKKGLADLGERLKTTEGKK